MGEWHSSTDPVDDNAAHPYTNPYICQDEYSACAGPGQPKFQRRCFNGPGACPRGPRGARRIETDSRPPPPWPARRGGRRAAGAIARRAPVEGRLPGPAQSPADAALGRFLSPPLPAGGRPEPPRSSVRRRGVGGMFDGGRRCRPPGQDLRHPPPRPPALPDAGARQIDNPLRSSQFVDPIAFGCACIPLDEANARLRRKAVGTTTQADDVVPGGRQAAGQPPPEVPRPTADQTPHLYSYAGLAWPCP